MDRALAWADSWRGAGGAEGLSCAVLPQGYGNMGYIQGGERVAKTRLGFGPPDLEAAERSTPERQELRRVFQECGKSYDFWIDSGLALVGSPDTVIRKIEAQQKRTGYDIFAARHRIGHLAPELARKSMQMFAEHVMPAFA